MTPPRTHPTHTKKKLANKPPGLLAERLGRRYADAKGDGGDTISSETELVGVGGGGGDATALSAAATTANRPTIIAMVTDDGDEYVDMEDDDENDDDGDGSSSGSAAAAEAGTSNVQYREM